MALVIYKRSNRTHAVLPITLKTTTFLILALIYLQILYLISYLSRPFWSSAQEFPPYKHNIERWEKTIINIIIGIVPFSNYRSPNPSTILHQDPISHRSQHTTYSSTSHVNLDGIPLLPPKAASTAFTSPPSMPQCYPETAIERMTPIMAMTQQSDLKLDLKNGTGVASGSAITKPCPVVDRYGKNRDPIYDTVKNPLPKSRSPNATRHHTGINTSGTGTGTASLSSTPLLGSHNSPAHTQSRARTQSQSHTTQSTSSLPHLPKEYSFNLNLNPSQSIEEQDEELAFQPLQPLHQVHNLNTLMRTSMTSLSHLPNTPRPSQKSPVHSLDGPHALASAVHSILTAKLVDDEVKTKSGSRSGAGDLDGLKLERASKCHSTESYPGKFPVSEGQDFSSLATAEYAFRERGTITVRPFSDY